MSASALQMELIAEARKRRARLFAGRVKADPPPITKDVKMPVLIRAVMSYTFPPGPFMLQGRDVLDVTTRVPTGREIMREFCVERGISFADITSSRRDYGVVHHRQQLCWLLKQQTTLSLPAIGRLLGGRDHTTVMHSIKKHQEFLDSGGVRKPIARKPLARLPFIDTETEHRVLVLRAKGVLHTEIADVLGISVNASRNILSKHNRRIKKAAEVAAWCARKTPPLEVAA